MYYASRKIQNFTDLNSWKHGHSLVLKIYKITADFPKSEVFGIVSQMRRSATSITSNITEGFFRQSNKEKTQFYYVSLASLCELQNQLIISKDVGYINLESYKKISELTIVVSNLINGMIKSLKK